MWHQKYKHGGSEKTVFRIQSKLSSFQVKVDCYKLFYGGLMIARKQKPRVPTQKAKESMHNTTEKSSNHERREQENEQRSYKTIRKKQNDNTSIPINK